MAGESFPRAAVEYGGRQGDSAERSDKICSLGSYSVKRKIVSPHTTHAVHLVRRARKSKRFAVFRADREKKQCVAIEFASKQLSMEGAHQVAIDEYFEKADVAERVRADQSRSGLCFSG